MMRSYKKPTMTVERFVPNEYVAACGDSGTTYLFTCDAGGGQYGEVYLETNGNRGFQTGRGGDEHLSGYKACGKQHKADSTDAFLDGYYVTEGWWGKKTVTPVVVWRGPNNDNTHCTTILNQNQWETAKS